MRNAPLLLFAITLCFVSPLLCAAQSTEPFLEVAKPLVRRLSGSGKHSYPVTLQADQFLLLEVKQEGIDILISLFQPDGSKFVEMDSFPGEYGRETLRFVAEVSGTYGIEIKPSKPEAAGTYEIKIAEMRAAKPEEKSLFADIRMLKKLNAERLIAESRQDKNALFHLFADDVMLITPTAQVVVGEKKAILSIPQNIPSTDLKTRLEIIDVKVLVSQDTAVVSSLAQFTYNVGTQSFTLQTLYSDTYVKRAARWQLLASHPAMIPEVKPTANQNLPVNTRLLDDYAGEYKISAGPSLTIYREGEKLFISGASAHELVPESTDTFFIKGSPTKYRFVRSVDGKVTHLAMMALGQEIKAIKVQ